MKQLPVVQIGVDLMGGDLSPEHIFDAAYTAASHLLSSFSSFHFVFYATNETISRLQKRCEKDMAHILPYITFEVADDVIFMDEKPSAAVKAKPRSSLALGVDATKEKKIDAFVSCGNTGALLTVCTLKLERLQKRVGTSCFRPALISLFPTKGEKLACLDLGASVVLKAKDLQELAYLGASYYKAVFGKKEVKVGLLNIGHEPEKGPGELQEAYSLLQNTQSKSFSFVGNKEASDVFSGDLHVLVTAGFAGNIFLKTCEGLSEFLFHAVATELKAAHLSSNEFERVRKSIRQDAEIGAEIVGLDALVIKCHGNASQQAIANTLVGVYERVQSGFLEKLKAEFYELE